MSGYVIKAEAAINNNMKYALWKESHGSKKILNNNVVGNKCGDFDNFLPGKFFC